MPIKGRSRALLQRVGRAEKDGTTLAQGRSLPPAWTLVTPYCKRTRPGRGTNTKATGFTSHACLPPAPLPPFALRLAPTHLGWGTRRQFTRRSRDPPGSKRRHLSIPPMTNAIDTTEILAIPLFDKTCFLPIRVGCTCIRKIRKETF
jgi:hypothetical protein